MDILQLKYFYETAKSESVTKTAKKYLVPPSSVSATIKKLEKELGTSLFDRTSNRITLNEKGRLFFKTANLILSELEEASASLTNQSDDNRQINILAKANRGKIISKIIDFNSKRPQPSFKVDLDFEETNYEKYQIIIQDKGDFDSDYECFMLSQYNIRLVASAQNPLCDRPLSLKHLKGLPFVTTGENKNGYQIFKKACERVGFTPELKIECNDYQCYDRCIKSDAGLGVTLATDTSFISPAMKYLDIRDFNEKITIYVYYKKQDYYGNVKDFIGFLKK